jgi:hypothetical protein
MVERNNNMTVTVNNYLDLRNLIINEVIGDVWLAYFIIMALIIIICIKNKIDTTTLVGILIFYTLIWISLISNLFILAIILVVVGALAYLGYTKMHSRG